MSETECSGLGSVYTEQVAASSGGVHVVLNIANAVAGTLVLDFQPCVVTLQGAVSQQAKLLGVVGSTLLLNVLPRATAGASKVVITDVIASECSELLKDELPLAVQCTAPSTSSEQWQSTEASYPGFASAVSDALNELVFTLGGGLVSALLVGLIFFSGCVCCFTIRYVALPSLESSPICNCG